MCLSNVNFPLISLLGRFTAVCFIDIFQKCKSRQFLSRILGFVWSVNLILQSKLGTRHHILGLSFIDGLYAFGAVAFLNNIFISLKQTCQWDCTS